MLALLLILAALAALALIVLIIEAGHDLDLTTDMLLSASHHEHEERGSVTPIHHR